MGKCQSNGAGRPPAFTVNDLVDLGIGQTKQAGTGCGPNIDGSQPGSCLDQLTNKGFSWPQNSEFSWGGLGDDCQMCSADYGCDCTSNSINGKRGSVKRVAYMADPAQCCIKGTQIINGNTCDPQYRGYSSTSCDEPMLNYCKNSKWSTPECMAWTQAAVNAGRTVPNVPISNYCQQGTNFTKPECQQWCGLVRNNTSMQSACDSSVTNYCSNNPSDPLCTCMQPPQNVSQIQNLMATSKVCWYKPCQTLTNDNYITSTMSNDKKNCVSTACLIDTGDISISGTNNQVKFNNNCATNLLKPSANTSSESSTPENSTSENSIKNTVPENSTKNSTPVNSISSAATPEEKNNNKMLLYEGIGVGLITLCLSCCCIFIVIFILYFNKSKTSIVKKV